MSNASETGAAIIDGRAVAARVRADVADGVAEFVASHGHPPGLATVLVGDDAASAIYVSGKQKASAQVGIRGFDHRPPADISEADLAALVADLNANPEVSGMIVQLPLPDHLDGTFITGLVDAAKDVDGLTALSTGLLSLGRPGLRPCTPVGVIELLRSVDAKLEGAEAVVVGRSNLFGKPMAQLLLEENATVTVCHSRTRDLPEVCQRADILIAAVGRAEMVKGDWIKPGAIVIDVGQTRNADGKILGDVDFEAARQRASAITPVPGGVGPMTIACLLRNTLLAARAQAGI
ncbi:MAG: tetrahydrofolate dehydrogenase/cyclohydrolase catalytic domain-containing protein [Solirubrobacteraceae bacterium]|jgi:methylenetetrahydrofolate dehydrogenase (NADP+)/methenyltetrahydrofolate cyclohydrolase